MTFLTTIRNVTLAPAWAGSLRVVAPGPRFSVWVSALVHSQSGRSPPRCVVSLSFIICHSSLWCYPTCYTYTNEYARWSVHRHH